MLHLAVNFWFIVLDPQDLRSRETGQSVITSDGDQILFAQLSPHLITFSAGALVVPEDRRP